MTNRTAIVVVLAAAVALCVTFFVLLFPSKNPDAASGGEAVVGSSERMPIGDRSSPKLPPSGADREGETPFHAIKAEAERGSPTAQRELSKLYALCGAYSLNSATQLATLDHFATLAPRSKTSGIDGVKERLKARCEVVDGGQPIPAEAWSLWEEQAAKSGDVASKVSVRMRSTEPLMADEVGELAGKVLTADDPEALLEMSQLMSRPVSGELPPHFRGIVGDPTAAAAWGVAACRSGAHCRSGSVFMDSVCMSTGRCAYANYEEFLISEAVSPAERARMNEIVNRILQMRSN